VASDEVEAIEVDVLEMKVGTDVMVEQGQLDAQLYYIGLSEVLAIAARMRSVEQCWLLMAEWDGYSDGLCRTYAPHAPAHCTVSRDPLLRHYHHSHFHIE
jgi:hypothetical protein